MSLEVSTTGLEMTWGERFSKAWLAWSGSGAQTFSVLQGRMNQ